MIFEFFKFSPGCLGDALQTAAALGTNSIGGDPVVGVCVT